MSIGGVTFRSEGFAGRHLYAGYPIVLSGSEGTCTPEIVEVYIREETFPTQVAYIGRPMGEHWCTFKETYKSQQAMPEADQTALRIAREISEERGLLLRVYNISKLQGRVRARLKGVKTTPTIIFGNEKLEGVSGGEDLSRLLKPHLTLK